MGAGGAVGAGAGAVAVVVVAAAKHAPDCGGGVAGGGDDAGCWAVEQTKDFGEWQSTHILAVDVCKKVARFQGRLQSLAG